jgi:hypothetical protein
LSSESYFFTNQKSEIRSSKSETNRSTEIRNPKHRKQKRACLDLFFDHLDLFRILDFEFFLASDSLGVLCAFARLIRLHLVFHNACLLLLTAYRSRSGFSTQVILLASAATTTDSTDHLSARDNRHPSNARKSLAAQHRSNIAPEGRRRRPEIRHVLGRASKRRRRNSFGAGSFRSEESSAITASGQDQATRIIDHSSRHWGS